MTLRERFATWLLKDSLSRMSDAAVFDIASHRAMRSFGLTDSTQPGVDAIRSANRGLFATCLRLRADAVASAIVGGRGQEGFRVRRTTRQGEAEDVELSHPWVRLLARPNPHRSAFEVWRWASLMRDLRGSADFIIQDDSRGVPVAMFEIFPEFGDLLPIPNAMGGVDGYVFQRSDGQRIQLEARDVVRLYHPDPVTPYESLSLLEQAAFELDKQLYADVYERDTLREGRFPPVVLATDKELQAPQAQQYGKAFLDAYMRTGGHTVKGIPVLGYGLKPIGTSMKAEDIALIDSRRLSDTHIFHITGVPQGLLSDQANRANADASQLTFAQRTVQPNVDAIAAQLTVAFERSFRALPGALLVAAPDVVPVDPELRARIDDIRLKNGTLTINEVRRRDGDEDVEGGDVPLVSAILTPLSQIVREPETQPASKTKSGQKDDDEDEDEDTDRTLRLFARKRSLRQVRGLSDEDRKKIWKSVDKKRKRAEKPIAAAAEQLLADQAADVRRRIMAQAERSLNPQRAADDAAVLTIDSVFDVVQWVEETLARLGAPIREALMEGFRTGALRVDLQYSSLPTNDPAALEVVRAIQGKCRSIPETLRAAINEELQKGLQAGESYEEIAERLQGVFDGMKGWKARQIAQTAGGGAFEAGEQIAYKEAGIKEQMWISQRDGRVRPGHHEADEQVVNVGEPFMVSPDAIKPPEALMHPCDPHGSAENVIGCRCVTFPIDKDE